MIRINFDNLPKLAEPEPVGKRTVRGNIWGNLNGYVSGKFWITFGDCHSAPVQRDAEEWRLRQIMPEKKRKKAKPE